MQKNTLSLLIISLITGICAIVLQIFSLLVNTDTFPICVSIASMFVLFIYFVINIYNLFRTNKLELTTKSLEEEKMHNKTLNILYDSIRGFRHDFNNIIQAIGGYVNSENIEDLKTYYSQLLDDCQRVNSLTILNPEIINDHAIYSLLTSKYYIADELGIKINLEVFLDLTTINMKMYELTRIFGILLDNAIEASSKCEDKIINIVIRKDSKVKRQLFQIENTYVNKDINIDRIFEKGYTSKPDMDKKSHGLGLWEVQQILKRNNNLNLYTTKDDTFFKQQLEIYL